MSRVKQSPRNSVNDRPSGWRLALRRQRRLLRPMAWIAAASFTMMLLVVGFNSAAPHSSGTLSSLRERLGAATAASGLRVTDVVIEGRANTPEPLLRASDRRHQGRPDPRLLARGNARRASKRFRGSSTRRSSVGCRARWL